jgi:glycosyltransferase involved in cell wall biosynthesis
VEGYVYPVRNVEALANALRRVLASPETAAAMGARARARISTWSFTGNITGLREALAQVTGRAVRAETVAQALDAIDLPAGGPPREHR